MADKKETIAVIGLGYVDIPVAVAMGRVFPTIGFDINENRIRDLEAGHDETGEVTGDELKKATISFTAEIEALKKSTFFIIAVPTPIDENKRPDLTPLLKASETAGAALSAGDVVVYESTVYPGVTEDLCVPVLERVSGLKCPDDFTVGYSPERINPGDREHTFERIVKVVSGQTPKTLERVAEVYASVVTAGVHKAPSIKVAEAAKVIENTQRDLNIALMNELALIFDRIGIRTQDVLDAAGTKWNFLRFTSGLVGGHCIGVDPYYLTYMAEAMGYHPQVILSGRRINDNTGKFVAQRAMKMLSQNQVPLCNARIAILGLTFKENVPDLRNSRVPDIIRELKSFGIRPLVHDPLGDQAEALDEYGVELCEWDALKKHSLDASILAVAHDFYTEQPVAHLFESVRDDGVVIDVRSALSQDRMVRGHQYWSL